jgi:hypothetical protein
MKFLQFFADLLHGFAPACMCLHSQQVSTNRSKQPQNGKSPPNHTTDTESTHKEQEESPLSCGAFIRVKSAGYFVKFDKIWLFIDFSGAAQRSV